MSVTESVCGSLAARGQMRIERMHGSNDVGEEGWVVVAIGKMAR